MVENQYYIASNKSNNIRRCIGVLHNKFLIPWLHTEDLVMQGLLHPQSLWGT